MTRFYILLFMALFAGSSAKATTDLGLFVLIEEPHLGYIEIKRISADLGSELFDITLDNQGTKSLSKNTQIIGLGAPFEKTIKLGKDTITVKLSGRWNGSLTIYVNGDEKIAHIVKSFLRLRIHPKADIIEIIRYNYTQLSQGEKAMELYKLSSPEILYY